jgi:hypothetical protein
MITVEQRLNVLIHVGKKIAHEVKSYPHGKLYDVIQQAERNNPWFTKDNQLTALNAIAEMLHQDKVYSWAKHYSWTLEKQRSVGLIMAGNIPAVGFHDLMAVWLSGHQAQVKLSVLDAVLLPWIVSLINEQDMHAADTIHWVNQLHKPEAVIATGSDNTARHFKYYFKNIPHLIRKNRNSIAILGGHESDKELYDLGQDIFSYFGLGCRNVSKLWVPQEYDFDRFFKAIESYGASMLRHHKYTNNYDYYRAIYLMERTPFLTNNFLHLLQHSAIASPVSVLHYEHYPNMDQLKQNLTFNLDKIQCIVSNTSVLGDEVPIGHSQFPAIDDYADGVDTIKFLLEL